MVSGGGGLRGFSSVFLRVCLSFKAVPGVAWLGCVVMRDCAIIPWVGYMIVWFLDDQLGVYTSKRSVCSSSFKSHQLEYLPLEFTAIELSLHDY
jgi:hypothetical protein